MVLFCGIIWRQVIIDYCVVTSQSVSILAANYIAISDSIFNRAYSFQLVKY